MQKKVLAAQVATLKRACACVEPFLSTILQKSDVDWPFLEIKYVVCALHLCTEGLCGLCQFCMSSLMPVDKMCPNFVFCLQAAFS